MTEETPKKKGFFSRLKEGLTKTRESISEKVDEVLANFRTVDEELFEELEEALISADMGVETTMDILDELRQEAKLKNMQDASEVKAALAKIIEEMMAGEDNALELKGKPSVIMVIGVNGVGKTTSIAKLAKRYQDEGKKVMLAAGDTFRAAAIDQLEIWAERVGTDFIRHQEGADPAAVLFDAITAAKKRGTDLIICDTAGRLHNKKNLMDELKKMMRIVERELPESSREVLLVLDATTGQNAVQQAKLFGEVADIDGIVLTKLDGTAKGGIVVAIRHEQKIPVKFIGVGETAEDLQPFDAGSYARALLGTE